MVKPLYKILLLISIVAVIITAGGYIVNKKPKINSYIPTLPVSTSTPMPQVISQDSADGDKTLVMKKESNKDGSATYSFYVSNNLIFARTLTNGATMSIPFNTWSPNNKYVFVKESTGNYFVMSLTGDSLNSVSDLNPASIFKDKYPDYKLTDITGWASPTLLILNINNDSGAPISMWFDIGSKSFIPLAERFN